MATPRKYRVLTGLNYGPAGRRVEACACKKKTATCAHVVSDLPAESIVWLLEQGHIERVDGDG